MSARAAGIHPSRSTVARRRRYVSGCRLRRSCAPAGLTTCADETTRGGAEGSPARTRALGTREHTDYGGQMKPLPLGFGKQPTELGSTRRGSHSTRFGKKMIRLITRKYTQ